MYKEKQTRTSRIVGQFLKNRFSAGTEERVQRWLIEERDAEEKERASFDFWQSLDARPDLASRRSWRRVAARVGLQTRRRPVLNRPAWRVAAALIPLFALAGGLWFHSDGGRTVQVAAALGETRQVVLPDSSQVWLRAGTTLSYPRKFRGGTRKVALEGEAWFAVRRDTAWPFTVTADALTVTVLGTEFDVKAWPDDDLATATLNSGRIEVAAVGGGSRILSPNEQLTYDRRTGEMNVRRVEADDVSGWTGGALVFLGAEMAEIAATLERHFDVAIEADRAFYRPGELYTVRFTRGDSLEEILDVLRDVAGDFDYTRTGDTVVIRAP